MTPQQYETHRNELIQLLDEAVALDMPEKYGAELKSTAKKCKEDQFEIALVGEFNGGKSTTFNAFCDGRIISPLGSGIKTSAGVITAQNISDNETKDGLAEWAEITFKTPYAVSFGLFDCLRDDLIKNATFRSLAGAGKSDEVFLQEMTTGSSFADLVDLTNPACRACIQEVLHEKWARWNEDRSKVSAEELDLLRIATLQLRYFDTPEYREFTAKTVLPLSSISKLVVYPVDWVIRWMEGENASFTLEECAFVFVDTVLARLHSQKLGQLGCRVTDCPGLFVSAYSWAVAKRAMHHADGVWYLIFGGMQIGEQDLKILCTIKSLGMLDKTNAMFNIRGSHEQTLREVFPATLSVLKAYGIDMELVPYNARLAFLSTQGDLLANHPELFTELDRANLLRDSKAKDPAADPKAVWTKMVRKMGMFTELEDLEDIDELDAESVATVRKESRFDDVLGTIERIVVARKSRSILIDNGSTRAAAALSEYEGVLKAAEDAASAKEEEWRQKVAAAKRELDAFVQSATSAIERSTLKSDKDAMARRLGMELIQTAIGGSFINDLTDLTVAVVKRNVSRFQWNSRDLKQAIVSDLNPKVGDLLKGAIVRTVSSWKQNPASVESLAELLRRTRYLCEDIHDLWKDRKLDADDLFKGFKPPQINTDEILGLFLTITNDLFLRPQMADLIEKWRRGIFTVIFDWTLGLIINVFKGIWRLIFGGSPDDEINGRKGLIRRELEQMLNSVTFREKAAEGMIEEFKRSQDGIIAKFTTALAKLSDDFKKERCQQPEEMFSKSAAERKAIAEANRKIREERVQPLRERIEAFEAQVVKELN